MKRLFDIVASLFGLLVLTPFFLIILVFIKLDSQGSIFFVQKRMGHNFKLFSLYKFRTMTVNAPGKGLQITTGGDQRITPVGRVLRKFKIDELPQLLNVLKGDMSLVGPRPEVERYVNIFRTEYEEILKVRPGITDYASIFYRDEETILQKYVDPEEGYVREVLPRKIQLCRRYLSERSFLVDLKIIFQTIGRIV